MNADIPFLRVWVRSEYVSKKSGLEEGYAFGIQSIPGRALGFHVMLKSGAHYRNIPIHAISLSKSPTPIELGDCQLWDCFSYHPEVHVFSYLKDHECLCHLRSKTQAGVYLFTVDWLPDSNEKPGWTLRPEQNKCAHVIALDDGNLAALPTNRIAWQDAYFIGSAPNPAAVGYTVQEDIWQSESSEFDVSKDERFFYGKTVAGDQATD